MRIRNAFNFVVVVVVVVVNVVVCEARRKAPREESL